MLTRHIEKIWAWSWWVTWPWISNSWKPSPLSSVIKVFPCTEFLQVFNVVLFLPVKSLITLFWSLSASGLIAVSSSLPFCHWKGCSRSLGPGTLVSSKGTWEYWAWLHKRQKRNSTEVQEMQLNVHDMYVECNIYQTKLHSTCIIH